MLKKKKKKKKEPRERGWFKMERSMSKMRRLKKKMRFINSGGFCDKGTFWNLSTRLGHTI